VKLALGVALSGPADYLTLVLFVLLATAKFVVSRSFI
jgi:hypothetical protein